MNGFLIRNIISGDEEYMRDESKKTGYADSISFPETEAQVIEIMTELNKTATSVTVQGSRTGLAAAAVPFGGHVMNLSRMDKITGMRQENGRFFVTVQPGVILQKLNKSLAARSFDTTGWSDASKDALKELCKTGGQMFTPDPTESTASIGGMVACNASGARSYRYGATRCHVNAMRCVLANGQTLALKRGQLFAKGKKVTLTTEQGDTVEAFLPSYKMPECKNASGYFCKENMDILDLLIGSDGTLAVMTELELSLVPAPKLIWGVTCFFPTQSKAVAFTKLVRTVKDGIASIEYFDACALDILRRQKAESTAFSGLPLIPQNYGSAVYTELHCETEEQAYDLLLTIKNSCENAGGDPSHTWVADNESERDLLSFFRHAVPESVNMSVEFYKRSCPDITKVGGDMSVPDDSFEAMLKVYDSTLEREELLHAAWGHIGDNHIHVNVIPRNTDEYRRGKALLNEWATAASKMGGAVSAEHGVGKIKSPLLEIMYGSTHIDEMAKLKAAFDPKYMLGRGNMFAQREEVTE